MTESLVTALRLAHPGARIDVAAPGWAAPVCERMNGIGKIHSVGVVHDRFDLTKRIALSKALRAEAYDLAIVLPNSWKSALAPFLAGIPVRRGYVGEMRYGLLNDIRTLRAERLPRTIDRFVALAGAEADSLPGDFDWPKLQSSEAGRAGAAARLGVTVGAFPIVAICPGAEYGPSRLWPAANFAAVARDLVLRGYAVWLFGSTKDSETASDIVALVASEAADGHVVNLCGRTQLSEAIDLIDAATAVITNDSGLMHVAAALGKPVVAIYGSTTPRMTPPLTARARIIERTLPCRPCFQRSCPLHHMNCLKLIQPDEVTGALLGLLGSP